MMYMLLYMTLAILVHNIYVIIKFYSDLKALK